MQRHTKCDDIIALAIELEFRLVVALVAIEDQEPVYALCMSRCILVEVPNPI